MMLNENHVVEAVKIYLQAKGFEIISSSYTDQTGWDIHAKKKQLNLKIEAKGETSSKPYTQRYGQKQTKGQHRQNLEAAIFKLLWGKLQEGKDQVQYGLAIPRNGFYEYYLDVLKPFFREQGTKIFWVEESGRVTECL